MDFEGYQSGADSQYVWETCHQSGADSSKLILPHLWTLAISQGLIAIEM